MNHRNSRSAASTSRSVIVLCYLQRPAGAVPGGEYPGQIGSHSPVHPDHAVLCLQLGQQVGGGHRLAQDDHPGAGQLRPVHLQGRHRLLPDDGKAAAPDKGDVPVQTLRPLCGHIGHLAAQAFQIVGL